MGTGSRVLEKRPLSVAKVFADLEKPFPRYQKSLPRLKKRLCDIGKAFSDIRKRFPRYGKSFLRLKKTPPDIAKAFRDIGKAGPTLVYSSALIRILRNCE